MGNNLDKHAGCGEQTGRCTHSFTVVKSNKLRDGLRLTPAQGNSNEQPEEQTGQSGTQGKPPGRQAIHEGQLCCANGRSPADEGPGNGTTNMEARRFTSTQGEISTAGRPDRAAPGEIKDSRQGQKKSRIKQQIQGHRTTEVV